jgi:hypothetical protein
MIEPVGFTEIGQQIGYISRNLGIPDADVFRIALLDQLMK